MDHKPGPGVFSSKPHMCRLALMAALLTFRAAADSGSTQSGFVQIAPTYITLPLATAAFSPYTTWILQGLTGYDPEHPPHPRYPDEFPSLVKTVDFITPTKAAAGLWQGSLLGSQCGVYQYDQTRFMLTTDGVNFRPLNVNCTSCMVVSNGSHLLFNEGQTVAFSTGWCSYDVTYHGFFLEYFSVNYVFSTGGQFYATLHHMNSLYRVNTDFPEDPFELLFPDLVIRDVTNVFNFAGEWLISNCLTGWCDVYRYEQQKWVQITLPDKATNMCCFEYSPFCLFLQYPTLQNTQQIYVYNVVSGDLDTRDIPLTGGRIVGGQYCGVRDLVLIGTSGYVLFVPNATERLPKMWQFREMNNGPGPWGELTIEIVDETNLRASASSHGYSSRDNGSTWHYDPTVKAGMLLDEVDCASIPFGERPRGARRCYFGFKTSINGDVTLSIGASLRHVRNYTIQGMNGASTVLRTKTGYNIYTKIQSSAKTYCDSYIYVIPTPLKPITPQPAPFAHNQSTNCPQYTSSGTGEIAIFSSDGSQLYSSTVASNFSVFTHITGYNVTYYYTFLCVWGGDCLVMASFGLFYAVRADAPTKAEQFYAPIGGLADARFFPNARVFVLTTYGSTVFVCPEDLNKFHNSCVSLSGPDGSTLSLPGACEPAGEGLVRLVLNGQRRAVDGIYSIVVAIN